MLSGLQYEGSLTYSDLTLVQSKKIRTGKFGLPKLELNGAMMENKMLISLFSVISNEVHIKELFLLWPMLCILSPEDADKVRKWPHAVDSACSGRPEYYCILSVF